MTKLSTDKARTRGCDQTVVTGETAVEDTQNQFQSGKEGKEGQECVTSERKDYDQLGDIME